MFGIEFIVESDDGKLKHIEHLDDLHFEGKGGFNDATDTLKRVHNGLQSGKLEHLTTKIDGSPSLVSGHHPETGKFFVATKSAFNKNPKLNYTHEDIDRNHGHAPGLASKLHAALEHLPKVLPKRGIFQGDVLHSHGEAESGSYTPNTITYHHPDESVKKTKFGIAFHTQYKGKTLEDARAVPLENHGIFGNHPDVHVQSTEYEPKTPAKFDSKKFDGHISSAESAHEKIDHSELEPHASHLKTFVNHTVKTGTAPTLSAYKKFLGSQKSKAVESVKTDKAKQQHADKWNHLISTANDSVGHALAAHSHLQAAKNILVHHLDKNYSGPKASINGKETGQEGYVHTGTGRPVKLVNRKVFSAANFAKIR